MGAYLAEQTVSLFKSVELSETERSVVAQREIVGIRFQALPCDQDTRVVVFG